eukprot:6190932-Pleurochrysis_carterae.AAC.2
MCAAIAGDWEWTEREILLHLEHILPREDVASLCAVGGLLAHLQQNTAAPLAVSKLERHRLERVMRVSPETMLALNIFEDRQGHGARGIGEHRVGGQDGCRKECEMSFERRGWKLPSNGLGTSELGVHSRVWAGMIVREEHPDEN